MTLTEIAELNRLWKHYVDSGELNVSYLQTTVKREALAAERGVIIVSRGLLRELRADRARIGRLARLSKED